MKKSKIDFTKVALKVAGVGAGAVASEIAASKIAPELNPTYKSIGLLVAGAALPILAPKMEILESVGDGMVANGAVSLAKSLAPSMFDVPTPPVSGIGERGYMIDEDFEVQGTGDEYDTTVNGPDLVAGDDPGLVL